VRGRLERDGDRVTDFHLWRVGPGPFACIVALVSDAPRSASTYKARLADISELSHVTVEIVEQSPLMERDYDLAIVGQRSELGDMPHSAVIPPSTNSRAPVT